MLGLARSTESRAPRCRAEPPNKPQAYRPDIVTDENDNVVNAGYMTVLVFVLLNEPSAFATSLTTSAS